MLAIFQEDGTTPWSKEACQTRVTCTAGANWYQFPSGLFLECHLVQAPADLCGFMFFSSLVTPVQQTVMPSIDGWGLGPRSGVKCPLRIPYLPSALDHCVGCYPSWEVILHSGHCACSLSGQQDACCSKDHWISDWQCTYCRCYDMSSELSI